MNKTQYKNQGFTLVELAIVLVIIGLIVGGVLVGRDLIKAAEIRGTIADVNKTRTAYTVFKSRFGCVPGDCPNITRFFADQVNGNGNKQIECSLGGPPYCPAATDEHVEAFRSMHEAGLIRSAAVEGDEFEPTKLNDCQLFMLVVPRWYDNLYKARTANYLQIIQNTDVAPYHDNCMTGEEAYQIDLKIDDGYAASGKTLGKTQFVDNSECADVPFTVASRRANYNRTSDVFGCIMLMRID